MLSFRTFKFHSFDVFLSAWKLLSFLPCQAGSVTYFFKDENRKIYSFFTFPYGVQDNTVSVYRSFAASLLAVVKARKNACATMHVPLRVYC